MKPTRWPLCVPRGSDSREQTHAISGDGGGLRSGSGAAGPGRADTGRWTRPCRYVAGGKLPAWRQVPGSDGSDGLSAVADTQHVFLCRDRRHGHDGAVRRRRRLGLRVQNDKPGDCTRWHPGDRGHVGAGILGFAPGKRATAPTGRKRTCEKLLGNHRSRDPCNHV